MAEQILPIKFPFGGLSETLSFSDQEPGTAREFQNMRAQDPVTGRLRGAQRSGLSKYLSSFLKALNTKVQDLVSFFVDNRQVSYTAIASGSETTEWESGNPSKTAVRVVKVDRQGNVYATDGNAGVVKYSADGRLLWRLAVPVGDTNHVIRAFALDDADHVFIGVSSGGLQEKAKLFGYDQLSENKTELLWEITPGGYIEDCRVFGNKLYTCQNHVDTKTSYVRIYEFQDTTNPQLKNQWRVPHPVNSIAVKADASVFVACEPSGDTTTNYWRLPDPRFADFSVDSEDWTPRQLTDYDKRVWAWYVADDIDETDVAGDFVDGVQVLRWRDRTKNGRHLIAPIDEVTAGSADVGPALVKNAMPGRHQGIRFQTRGNVSPLQSLKTPDNNSITKVFAQNQRSMIPAYTDSGFALLIACRPSDSLPPGDNQLRWIFGQDRDNQSSGSNDHILYANSSDAGGPTAAFASAGGLYWYTGQSALSGGDGAGSSIKSGSFLVKPGTATANPGNFVIVAMVCDGAISGDVSGQESLFQINGNPIDKFMSRASVTIFRTQLGIFRLTKGQPVTPASNVSGFLGDIFEIVVLRDQSLTQKILTYDALEATSTAQSQTVNELTNLVGYMAHRVGAQLNLPFGTAAVNNYPHPYGKTGSSPDFLSGPPNQAGTAVSSAQALANKRFGAVVKYSSEGKIKWCANEIETLSGNRTGGYGYAVAVNPDGNVYSAGPAPTGAAGEVEAVRMIVDQGDDFSVQSGDGAWVDFLASTEQPTEFMRMDVDEFGNLYAPLSERTIIYKKDGTKLHTLTDGALSVAIDRRIPDYRTDLTTKTAELIVLGGGGTSTGVDQIQKRRLVSVAQTSDSPRSLITLGVSGGDIVGFSPSGLSAVTGGSGALDSTAYVQSTTLFKKAYWTDGRQVKQYSSVTNTVTALVATSAGTVPARCSLIESWRGRLALARSADDPHNWFLSKKDDPGNWDFFPPTPTETDAVAGSLNAAGLCPDIINCIIPYSEDVLIFGGDHTIWALIGDPAAGGRFEQISDITGMSFGRPYAKDPEGVLYFFGSQGGLYRWIKGSQPERISASKIDRQLQEIDLSTHYIRLAYNRRDEGIHIFQCPFGAGGTQINHWFYEIKTKSFSKDLFGTGSFTNVQPTAVAVIDGDEFNDRAVLLGCEDGYVRKWDMDAKSDDFRPNGTTYHAIDALVTLFPLPGVEEGSGLEVQYSGLTVVLAEDHAGARYELFASEAPETLGLPLRAGELKSGRNPPKWDRVVGPYCGLRLRNSAPQQRWAYERGYIHTSMAGLARPRT